MTDGRPGPGARHAARHRVHNRGFDKPIIGGAPDQTMPCNYNHRDSWLRPKRECGRVALRWSSTPLP